MITFLTIAIALVCLLLIGAVLIQNPKGGGLDTTFGGAGNQMFGAAKSTDFIEKATWILAAILIVLCLVTSLLVKSNAPTTGDNSIEYQAPIKDIDNNTDTYYM
jgi:preprotein translocase subunit SecG